jgi:hypothetical protein
MSSAATGLLNSGRQNRYGICAQSHFDQLAGLNIYTQFSEEIQAKLLR